MKTIKAALVFAGSRGIGREIVLGLAAQAVHVVFTYASNEAAAKEVEKAAVVLGGKALGIKADISNLTEVKNAIAYIPQHFGKQPDYFINNAFPRAIFAPTAFLPESDYDSLFDAVKGHYFALQHISQNIQDGGTIIVISSGAAAMPQPASGAYAGAKSAIEKFALSLAKELGQNQVNVNVVSPGVTNTEGLVAPNL